LDIQDIEPASIAFDIDGVVADTMTLFLAIADQNFGISGLRYEDITEYDLQKCLGIDEILMWEIIVRILGGNYAMPLNPIADAPAVLKRINQRHQPTLFVTARPDAEHISEWLCKMLDVPEAAVEVIATGSFEDKREILMDRGVGYFVEDRLETCFLIADAGIRPIVFKQPWNRKPHPFPEVGTWRELESMIRLK